jgi:hypothetical protein
MTDDPTVIEMTIDYYRNRLKQDLSPERRLAVEQLLARADRGLLANAKAIKPKLP